MLDADGCRATRCCAQFTSPRLQGIFEWDQSFVAYMFGLNSLELALSNLIAVVKSKTVAGFVPGLSAGTSKTRTSTQPPVTAKALHEIVKRWGPNRTRWAVELCFDDLYNWNTWMYTQRREIPAGLLTCGDSPYASYVRNVASVSAYDGDLCGCVCVGGGSSHTVLHDALSFSFGRDCVTSCFCAVR